MREIKFRAWNIKEDKYMWPYPEAFNIIGEVTMFDCLKQLSIKDYDNLIIEQYTGLKDKNGKEIYEGDIIKIGYVQWVIIYRQEICSFEGLCLSDSTRFRVIRTLDNKSYKVIGNIHDGQNHDTI